MSNAGWLPYAGEPVVRLKQGQVMAPMEPSWYRAMVTLFDRQTRTEATVNAILRVIQEAGLPGADDIRPL